MEIWSRKEKEWVWWKNHLTQSRLLRYGRFHSQTTNQHQTQLIMLSARKAGNLLLWTLCASVLTAQVRAASYGITNGNSFALLDPSSGAGMYNWSVLTSPSSFQNQLNQQSFWYRVGGTGAESALSSLTLGSVNVVNPSTITTTYLDGLGRFNLSVTYSLLGGSLSSGTAQLAENIAINNLTGSPLDFHFFQYSDFNLGAGDTDVISRNPFTGRINQVDQFSGSSLVETVLTPNANHGETDTVPNTLNRLTDGTATTLNDALTTASGNVAWALQWDTSIGAGGSFLIGKQLNLQVQFVPEPSSVALISLGLAICAIRKRRQS